MQPSQLDYANPREVAKATKLGFIGFVCSVLAIAGTVALEISQRATRGHRVTANSMSIESVNAVDSVLGFGALILATAGLILGAIAVRQRRGVRFAAAAIAVGLVCWGLKVYLALTA